VIENHPVFGFQRLKVIIGNSRKLAPELMHIIDRLYVNLLEQLPGFKSEEIYIDADVTPRKPRATSVDACYSSTIIPKLQKH